MRTADRARYAAVRDAARAALARGIGGRWPLPGAGLLAIERPLPFFVIAHLVDPAVRALSGGVASRLVVSRDASQAPGADALAHDLTVALAARAPALLVVWLSAPPDSSTSVLVRIPDSPECRALAEPTARAVHGACVDGRPLHAVVERGPPISGRLSLSSELAARVCEMEVAVPPVYRDREGTLLPLRLEELRRWLSGTLARIADAFVATMTPGVRPRPRLGTATLDPAAQAADRILCAADDAFDVLLQLTPANLEAIWRRLVATRFEEEPEIHYRPLPFDPVVLKRRVFEAPVEAVEDPWVAELLRDKQEELSRMLSMLRDRGEAFLHESEQVFGRPDEALLALARRILDATHAARADEEPLALQAILERTRAHMLAYREQDPFFPEEIEVRDDIVAGMMVLRGRLLLRGDLALTPRRLAALLEHEVGTHVLTWFNGSAQPLRVLGRGLAGYEALQEGLAVLAEHLAGALDPTRLRVLAARVVAASEVSRGASFLEVFHRLYREHGQSARAAFQTTVRARRGGGMTKDLVYLRGLVELLGYVIRGGALEPLYSGKLALRHLSTVEALVQRGMLAPPRVLPIVLREPEAQKRLAALRLAKGPIDVALAMASGRAPERSTPCESAS